MAVKASASSSRPITGWHVYVDGKDSYASTAASSFSTSIAVATGTHTVVVRAWDASGAFGSQTVQVAAGAAASAPAPGPTPTTGPISVSVSAPQNYASVTSPVALNATAGGSKAITGWHVYVDGKDSYSGPATNNINGSIPMASGTHSLVVRAWDTSGVYASQTLQVTVGSSGSTTPPPQPPPPPTTTSAGLPTPPSTAKVFSNIEEMTTGWTNCGSAACAGGNGTSSYWQAFNQTTPSMDGRSMQINNAGVWANALWWRKMGANNAATNMLWDFWVYLDDKAAKYGQSLEYDSFQFVGGYNYMIGTQCNYGAGVWDTWNEVTQKWLHTSIPCPKFAANTWHHIQQYVTMNHTNHTYTYKTFVIDGKVYNLNQTQPAKYLAWEDNLGAQWQLDVNATGGAYSEWVDKAKLTIW